jgi:hypothetical protein
MAEEKVVKEDGFEDGDDDAPKEVAFSMALQ